MRSADRLQILTGGRLKTVAPPARFCDFPWLRKKNKRKPICAEGFNAHNRAVDVATGPTPGQASRVSRAWPDDGVGTGPRENTRAQSGETRSRATRPSIGARGKSRCAPVYAAKMFTRRARARREQAKRASSLALPLCVATPRIPLKDSGAAPKRRELNVTGSADEPPQVSLLGRR